VAEATIIYERTITDDEGNESVIPVDMTGWPPTTWLVRLDTPLKRFDPETGDATEYDHIALTIQDANPRASFVFPSNAEGGFVDPSMQPMRTRDYGTRDAVLGMLGYSVTNGSATP